MKISISRAGWIVEQEEKGQITVSRVAHGKTVYSQSSALKGCFACNLAVLAKIIAKGQDKAQVKAAAGADFGLDWPGLA
jgi:hypothetical protein